MSGWVTVIDTGDTVDRKHYAPWGETTNAQGIQQAMDESRRGFTGHENIARADLVHMNGRVYDPVTSSFLAADPVISRPGSITNLARYQYVNNSPLIAVDPSGYTGEYINEGIDLLNRRAGAALEVQRSSATTYISHDGLKDAWLFQLNASGTQYLPPTKGQLHIPVKEWSLRTAGERSNAVHTTAFKMLHGGDQELPVFVPNSGGNMLHMSSDNTALVLTNEGTVHSYNGLLSKMKCNCHGYSLGTELWIDNPDLILRNPNYFESVAGALRTGDIVAFKEANDDHILHTAVVATPNTEHPLQTTVKHMPGFINEKASEDRLERVSHEFSHHFEVFRPKKAIIRR